MTERRVDLGEVSTSELRRLRDAITHDRVRLPVTESALVAFGIRARLPELAFALGGHARAACLAILDAALSERARHTRPAPELVWTGPEGEGATARDTAIVLRSLFERARRHVVLAGFSFDHAEHILRPLYESMRDHGVEASFFVHIEQPRTLPSDEGAYAREQTERFLHESWPFGAPRPRVYYDPRATRPGGGGRPWVSLHSKCVTVDDTHAFIGSANFTLRAQERNIETGVLLHDASFAAHLSAQWMGLVAKGLMVEG